MARKPLELNWRLAVLNTFEYVVLTRLFIQVMIPVGQREG